jgi:hypothetical protein
MGPASHSPSSVAAISEQTASSQSFVFVVAFGYPQIPPDPHSLVFDPAVVHGVPICGPKMQRFPPQTVAPTAAQSAFDAQGVAAALLHVSQKHLRLVNPGARQLGLDALSVRVTTELAAATVVEYVRKKSSAAGGQSKLPKETPA